MQAAKETPEGQAKTRSVARFNDKLSKFKRIEDAGAPGTVGRHPNRPATQRLAPHPPRRAHKTRTLTLTLPAPPSQVRQEELHKMTLKNKLAAFEAQSKKQPEPTFKKTWKNTCPGNWKQKTQFAGGPPPKKSINDLP